MRELIEGLETLLEERGKWKKHGGGKKAWWTWSQPWGFYIVRSLGGGDDAEWAAIYEPAKPGGGPMGKGGCVDSSGKVAGGHASHKDAGAAKAACAAHVERMKEISLKQGTKAGKTAKGGEAPKGGDAPKGGKDKGDGNGPGIKKKKKEKAEGDKIQAAGDDAQDQLDKLKKKKDKVSADDLKQARGIQKAAHSAAAPTYASDGEMPGKGGVGVQTLGKARSWLAKLADKLGEFIKGVAGRRNERVKNED